MRAVLGQQVSVSGARTTAGRLDRSLGAPLTTADGSLTHRFPTAAAIAVADPARCCRCPLSAAGPAGAHRALAGNGPGDRLELDPGSDRVDVEARLLALPGIGPWTAGYIAMRALADPDVFLATDLGARQAAERIGLPSAAPELERRSCSWRPWRSYALQHLWATLEPNDEVAVAKPPFSTQ